MLILLIKKELLDLRKVYGVGKSSALLFLAGVICTSFCVNIFRVKEHSITSIILMIIMVGLTSFTSRSEYRQSLESMLACTNGAKLALARFTALLLINGMVFCLAILMFAILYDYGFREFALLYFNGMLLSAMISALAVLGAAMNSYFYNSGLLLHIILLPLLAAPLAIIGVGLETQAYQWIWALLGINLIFIPVLIATTGYLLNNSYNYSD